MKSSQILKKARKLIASGECYFICNAVFRVCGGTGSVNKGYEIEKYISKQLAGESTLNSWLRKEHGNDPFSSKDNLKQTRLNWIDNMIELYKAKGD